MNKLNFEITIDEGNKIISALACMPYRDVFELIAKLQKQAYLQTNEDKKHHDDLTKCENKVIT